MWIIRSLERPLVGAMRVVCAHDARLWQTPVGVWFLFSTEVPVKYWFLKLLNVFVKTHRYILFLLFMKSRNRNLIIFYSHMALLVPWAKKPCENELLVLGPIIFFVKSVVRIFFAFGPPNNAT